VEEKFLQEVNADRARLSALRDEKGDMEMDYDDQVCVCACVHAGCVCACALAYVCLCVYLCACARVRGARLGLGACVSAFGYCVCERVLVRGCGVVVRLLNHTRV
jgi:hypothetical protein